MYNPGFSLEILTHILLELAHSFLPKRAVLKSITPQKQCSAAVGVPRTQTQLLLLLPYQRQHCFHSWVCAAWNVCAPEYVHPQIIACNLYFLFILLTSGMGNSWAQWSCISRCEFDIRKMTGKGERDLKESFRLGKTFKIIKSSHQH